MIEEEIIFLGICETAYMKTNEMGIEAGDIFGIKKDIHSYIYPFNFNGTIFLFAISNKIKPGLKKVRFLDSKEKEIMTMGINTNEDNSNKNGNWSIIPARFDIDATIVEPGKIDLELEGKKIGSMEMKYIDAPKYDEEFISFVKGNPLSAKNIVLRTGCKNCNGQLKTYTAIERDKELEKEGNTWFKELPDTYICKCGKTKIDLKYMKQNLHILLLNRKANPDISESKSLYTQKIMEGIYSNFEKLIKEDRKEEEIQKFIEKNPIILQVFSSQRYFFKKPILSMYETDICVLNSKKELKLIEIEKPNTKLMKKDGGVSSELQHAMDQVRAWLHQAREERSAVLKCIGLESSEVSIIKGAVIVGRDEKYDKEKMRKLKGQHFGEIDFYTYDDILRSFKNITLGLKDLN